jgi:hypothetical protein
VLYEWGATTPAKGEEGEVFMEPTHKLAVRAWTILLQGPDKSSLSLSLIHSLSLGLNFLTWVNLSTFTYLKLSDASLLIIEQRLKN